MSSTLRVYFWLDGTKHSWLKVRSSVIRLVKRSIQDHGFALAVDSLAVTFPHRATVEIARGTDITTRAGETPAAAEGDAVATDAESDLSSEAPQVEQQAEQSRVAEEGRDLLASGADDAGRAPSHGTR